MAGLLVDGTELRKGSQSIHISIENQKVEKQKDQALKETQDQICKDCGIHTGGVTCPVKQQREGKE